MSEYIYLCQSNISTDIEKIKVGDTVLSHDRKHYVVAAIVFDEVRNQTLLKTTELQEVTKQKNDLSTTEPDEKVVPLFSDRPSVKQAPPDAQAGMVRLLESLLVEAKAGEVSAVCVVAFGPNGSLLSGCWGTSQYVPTIGALEDLKYKLIRNHLNLTDPIK